MSKIKIFSLLLSVYLLFGFSVGTSPHKYYASLAQMNYNEKESSLECTLTLFIDDVENYLSKKNGRRITLDSKEFQMELLKLIRSEFQIKNAKKEVNELEWIGFESSVQTCTVYLEFKNILPNKKYLIQQVLMIPYFETQQNLVNIQFYKDKKSYLFKAGATAPQELIITRK